MVHTQDKSAANEEKCALSTVIAARELWLTAATSDDLQEVEKLYRHALTSKARDESSDEPAKKKRKGDYYNLSREDYRQASEKLALLLCQSGRCKKAKKPLAALGFKCKLAERVLDYPVPSNNGTTEKCRKGTPCQIVDRFLTKNELERLRSVFLSRSANYWTTHNYRVEPPSPYFSYVIPLAGMLHNNQPTTNKFGFIGDLIQKILSCPMLVKKFPGLPETEYVEMWAHNRPHASGHQMHFDSDDEGRGGVRNPIISTILYITEENATAFSGGPSLITNQEVESTHLATRGWLAHPKPERLVAFDGRYLHGVVPGKGVGLKDSRRVTLMFAFWKHLKVRRGLGPASARPFPVGERQINVSEWAKNLITPLEESEEKETSFDACVESPPIELDVVYERLDGKPWKKSHGLPSYDEVFQGF